jgi:hypothetical protein
MDNHFSSPDLQSYLTKQKMNLRGTFRPDSRRVPGEFRSKTLQLKWGDVRVRTSGDKAAVFGQDECDVHMLTNSHNPLAPDFFFKF